jgi:hydrogenase nickel incorporation protein HypB
MCKDCGCGLPGENPVGVSAHHHDHDHDPGSGPGHHHRHQHDHPLSHARAHGEASHDHLQAAVPSAHRVLEVRQAILGKNDRLAERNRGFFQAHGLLVLNILSSPGSGKTTFIRETIHLLGKRLNTGVIVGDLATDNDAQRLRESGAPVVQINTGTVCHLEAEMVARAVKELDLKGLGLLVIENVGNLVCPAAYDLGEDLRVVMLSVTEGEDKPLKYPPAFQSVGVVVISKVDLATACDYDRVAALANLRRLVPKVKVFETSAKTGQGMDAWCEFLLKRHKALKAWDPLGA